MISYVGPDKVTVLTRDTWSAIDPLLQGLPSCLPF